MRRWLVPLGLAVVGVAAAARADDSRYQDFPVGSRALALGGAFVALSDDPSGLSYNPAGICDARRLNVNVSASLYGFERQSRGALRLDNKTFSLAALDTLNVIPGEVGLMKGYGPLDQRGTPFAIGLDVTVPSFRSYGVETSRPIAVHTRVFDRTFDVAAGAALRFDDQLNLGIALHYMLRLYDTAEDALSVSGDPAQPAVGVYHADASFQDANLVPVVGAKLRLLGGEWLLGAALGLPGIPLSSAGKADVQDVVADPARPDGQRTVVTVLTTTDVASRTAVPALLRVGAAWVQAHRWTLTGQLTGHLGTTYERFSLPAPIAARLRLPSHVQRLPVIDLNLGGELLLDPSWSIALGLFTDSSGAPAFRTGPDGTLTAGSSRLPRVGIFGGTATLGLIGLHSITRLGISAAYGSGSDAVAADPTGIADPRTYRVGPLRELFLYVFLATTFRY